MSFAFHYLWWNHTFTFSNSCPFSMCWELCTACSGVVRLHCSLNRQFCPSWALLSNTACQGLFWWTHLHCHSYSGWAPAGKRVSWTAALPYLVVFPLQCCCGADYSWWLHFNHILHFFKFFLIWTQPSQTRQWKLPQVNAHKPHWAVIDMQGHTPSTRMHAHTHAQTYTHAHNAKFVQFEGVPTVLLPHLSDYCIYSDINFVKIVKMWVDCHCQPIYSLKVKII